MQVRLFNTFGREVQDFVPIEPDAVGMYTCGPTVYDYAHIGNMRTYIFEDILRRTLEYTGYKVRHVMNITDVGHLTGDEDDGEDKMLEGARRKGMSVWEIAAMYTNAFFNDTDRLHILRPHVACRATEHIEDMIDLIRRLEEKGYVYIANGNVFFDTGKFESYGKMALLDKQELRAGARIEVDTTKKHPADFALWFTNSKFEHQTMMWDSPWGRGYPGWHLECSAMSMKYLGEHFDIHCGGVDHIPVHHTNEIAQSEAATGKKWVNYWLHGEFLLMNQGKMAKSTGNFLTLQGLVDSGYDPEDFRYLCLGAHYRSQLNFSEDSMSSARSSRRNLIERLVRLREAGPPAPLEKLNTPAREYLDEFAVAIRDDLNMPKALSVLWNMMKDENLGGGEKLCAAFAMDRVFALDLERAAVRENTLDRSLAALIEKREEARRNRDYALADSLRNELAGHGVILEDTASGTRWRRES
ncbi:MAG: cysteine--tRNA ligase [Spirochaetales bacterium]|nr:cysteine--tRNA ligase [Spirochaetales bacterium]